MYHVFSHSRISQQKGFTLVELTVVLVIIGLIVAGVVGGKSLIRAAKVRAVVAEVHNYQTAFNVFVDKYNNLPGDFPRAEGTPGFPFEGQTTGNGNGNGQISWGSNTGSTANSNEGIMAWQHLNLEGLIGGPYGSHLSNADAVAGTSIPVSELGNDVGYAFDYNPNSGAENHILLGKENAGTINNLPAISAPLAARIDEKLDDGMPGSGNVLSLGVIPPGPGTCTDEDNDAATAPVTAGDITDDTYQVIDKSATALECIMAFRMD